MVRRPFRVLEIGVGAKAKKIINLALRHQNTEFTGIDIRKVRYGKQLLVKGLNLKPKNLQIKGRTNAISFLREQPDNSFSHIYTHFVLQHLGYTERQTLFHHVMRVLKPNSTFAVVDDAATMQQFRAELEKHGFAVHARRISSQELLKLGSEWSRLDATIQASGMAHLNSFPERLPKHLRRAGVQTRAEAAEFALNLLRVRLERRYAGLKGNASSEGQKAVQNLLSGLQLYFSQKPFVVITAKKPMKKN